MPRTSRASATLRSPSNGSTTLPPLLMSCRLRVHLLHKMSVFMPTTFSEWQAAVEEYRTQIQDELGHPVAAADWQEACEDTWLPDDEEPNTVHALDDMVYVLRKRDRRKLEDAKRRIRGAE